MWRRSVYVYRKRGLPFPMFEAFDLPDQNLSCGRRNVSTVPTQALMLLNDEWVLKQAKLFANQVSEAAKNDPAREVELAYRIGAQPQAGAGRAGGSRRDRGEAQAGGSHARAAEFERVFVHEVSGEELLVAA